MCIKKNILNIISCVLYLCYHVILTFIYERLNNQICKILFQIVLNMDLNYMIFDSKGSIVIHFDSRQAIYPRDRIIHNERRIIEVYTLTPLLIAHDICACTCAHRAHIYMCVASVLSKLQINKLVSSLFALNLLSKSRNVSNGFLTCFCLCTCVQETLANCYVYNIYVAINVLGFV